MSQYIYIYIYIVCVCVCVEREREREREGESACAHAYALIQGPEWWLVDGRGSITSWQCNTSWQCTLVKQIIDSRPNETLLAYKITVGPTVAE